MLLQHQAHPVDEDGDAALHSNPQLLGRQHLHRRVSDALREPAGDPSPPSTGTTGTPLCTPHPQRPPPFPGMRVFRSSLLRGRTQWQQRLKVVTADVAKDG